jgi:hypothetical protein
VAGVSWLKYARLAYFAKPRSERQLYRLVKRHKICRIVEVGISDVARTMMLVRVAQRFAADGPVSYTGIDWFDARPANLPQLTLKQVHCQLRSTAKSAGQGVRSMFSATAGAVRSALVGRKTDQTPTMQSSCRLQASGAQVRLVPGEPARSLSVVANAHQHTGLLIFSGAVTDSDLASAWYYVPRMLDANSIVLRERLATAEPAFEPLSTGQIATFVAQSAGRRAA